MVQKKRLIFSARSFETLFLILSILRPTIMLCNDKSELFVHVYTALRGTHIGKHKCTYLNDWTVGVQKLKIYNYKIKSAFFI